MANHIEIVDGTKASYYYAALAFAPFAAPTDFIVIQGSPTRTLRLRRIRLTGAATAAGTMPVQLVKRSTAGVLGSAVLTAIAATKNDSGDPAATGAVSTVGTANFTTLGTLTGVVGVGRLQMTALATGLAVEPVIWDFSTRRGKACILRGISEFLCINLNGAAIPSGGVIDYEIEIEEDGS